MKKNLLFLAVASLMTTGLFAQTIPNAGFESWTNMGTYSDPDNWGTLNSVTTLASIYTCTQGTPGHPGNYYLKLVSSTVFTQVVPGIAATGIINASTQTVSGGFPVSTRPYNLTGAWQYMVYSAADLGSINVLLTKWNTSTNSRDTISYTNHTLPGMAMAWANFTIPLTYQMAGNPDTCMIVLAASNSTPAANSYLYIDNLAFTGTNNVGISENVSSPNNLNIYPNPADKLVNVRFDLSNTTSAQIQLVDVTGKLILEMTPNVSIGENMVALNLDGIENGIYFVRLLTNNGIETRKIIVE